MGVSSSELAKDACTAVNGNFLSCFKKFSGQTVATEAGGFEDQLLVDANTALQKRGMAPMKLLAFAQDTQAFQAFTNGTASGVWVDDPQFHFFNINNGGKYRAAFGGDDPTPLALTTVKSNVALASAFVKALKTIKANGTYGAILKKWDVEAVPSFGINPPASQ
jgi:polar amino acid transport system substrate-binding protein